MAMFYVMLHTLQLQGNVLAEGGVGVFEDILENTYSCRYIFHWHTAVFKWQVLYCTNYRKTCSNMQNEDVVRLQQRLKNWEYYDGKITGVYDFKTYLAVRDFQKTYNLPVTGIAGEETLAAMGLTTLSRWSEVRAQSSRISDEQLLARAINGEARGEPYEGQVAVVRLF